MNDDQFADLKQFIDARISQSEANFDARITQSDAKLQVKIDELRSEVHDGFAGVGEAIDDSNKRLDERDKEFDQRLTKLEQQAA